MKQTFTEYVRGLVMSCEHSQVERVEVSVSLLKGLLSEMEVESAQLPRMDYQPLAERAADAVEAICHRGRVEVPGGATMNVLIIGPGIIPAILAVLTDAPELIALHDRVSELHAQRNFQLQKKLSLTRENEHLQDTLKTLSAWLLEANLGPKLVRVEFVAAMANELRANAEKGVWHVWQPAPEDIAEEIKHHAAKLCGALDNMDAAKIREHAADLANFCMKADETHGADASELYTEETRAMHATERHPGFEYTQTSVDNRMLDATTADWRGVPKPHGENWLVNFARGKQGEERGEIFTVFCWMRKIPATGKRHASEVVTDAGRRYCNALSFQSGKCIHGVEVRIQFHSTVDDGKIPTCGECMEMERAGHPAFRTASGRRTEGETRRSLRRFIVQNLAEPFVFHYTPPDSSYLEFVREINRGIFSHIVQPTERERIEREVNAGMITRLEAEKRLAELAEADGAAGNQAERFGVYRWTHYVGTNGPVDALHGNGVQRANFDSCTHVLRRDDICPVCEPHAYANANHAASYGGPTEGDVAVAVAMEFERDLGAGTEPDAENRCPHGVLYAENTHCDVCDTPPGFGDYQDSPPSGSRGVETANDL